MTTDNNLDSMTEVIQAFIQEKRDKKEIALLKDKPNKKNIGGINYKLEKIVKSNVKKDSEEQNLLNNLLKKKKLRDQTVLEFHKSKMNKLISLSENLGLDNIEPIRNEYLEAVEKINTDYDVATWLTDNCRNAKGLSFATHVIKLTHSSISGASSVYDQSEVFDARYLTTSSIHFPVLDSALDNAAFAATAALLQLSYKNKKLSEFVLEGDNSPFSRFSNDIELINKWMYELKQAFGKARKSSHFLAKQIYFPCSESPNYHLLLPIVSSSLAHFIFERVFDPEYKKAREKRKAGKYSPLNAVYFPKKAIIKVTASNHTNASDLNGKRSGKLQLLPSLPPKWDQKLRIPQEKESLFGGALNAITLESVSQLRKLLMAIKSNDLNRRDPKFHKKIMELVNEISEIVFSYVLSIQKLKDQAGWSSKSKLKNAHKLWLDPFRDDETFQKQRKEKAWQEEIKQDFAMWLSNRLETKKLKMGKQQQALWLDIFSPSFRTFMANMEVDR